MKYTLLLLTAVSITVMGAAGGQLIEFSYTQEQVYGKYAASEDNTRGIVFVSRSDDYLLVRTFSGQTLVETSPTTENDGQKLRSIYITSYEYLQYENSAYSDRPVGHNKPLSYAIHDLLGRRELGLLEKAAEAVGNKGLNGQNTPATLPFFLFALRITQLAEHSNTTVVTTVRDKRESYMHCAGTCPPCPNDKCIGLCGKGCTCWRWICGDCCWHLACYDHDLCCKKSWLQSHCLLPKVVYKFRCNQHYNCQ